MGVMIEAPKTVGLRDKVKVMIGGALVTEEYAKFIGADAFAPDAASATCIAR
jgi:5-methyltetrahydrofolate--homocysteine methyltransferase